MTQKSFFNSKSEFSKSRIAYGGDTRGRRKAFRPLNSRKSLHLTLKSSHARGKMSLLSHQLKVKEIVAAKALRYRITLQRFVNVGNHLHMIVKFKTRREFQSFLRVVSGLIARHVTKANRGHAFGKRFWDYLAHTRIVTGMKDFARLLHYFDKNEAEVDAGPDGRRAIEMYDEIAREAARKKISFDVAAAIVSKRWARARK